MFRCGQGGESRFLLGVEVGIDPSPKAHSAARFSFQATLHTPRPCCKGRTSPPEGLRTAQIVGREFDFPLSKRSLPGAAKTRQIAAFSARGFTCPIRDLGNGRGRDVNADGGREKRRFCPTEEVPRGPTPCKVAPTPPRNGTAHGACIPLCSAIPGELKVPHRAWQYVGMESTGAGRQKAVAREAKAMFGR